MDGVFIINLGKWFQSLTNLGVRPLHISATALAVISQVYTGCFFPKAEAPAEFKNKIRYHR